MTRHSTLILFFLSAAACGSHGRAHGHGATSSKTAEPAVPMQDGTLEQDASAAEPRNIRCQCEVIGFDPEYLYCDDALVEEGEPSSIGSYPWFRIKIISPEKYKGKELEIIYQFGRYTNKAGEADALVGKPCDVALPADFLDGDYKTILGDSVEELTVKQAAQ